MCIRDRGRRWGVDGLFRGLHGEGGHEAALDDEVVDLLGVDAALQRLDKVRLGVLRLDGEDVDVGLAGEAFRGLGIGGVGVGVEACLLYTSRCV